MIIDPTKIVRIAYLYYALINSYAEALISLNKTPKKQGDKRYRLSQEIEMRRAHLDRLQAIWKCRQEPQTWIATQNNNFSVYGI